MATIEKLSIALPHDMVEAIETRDLRGLVNPALEALDRGEGIPAEEVFARLRAKCA